MTIGFVFRFLTGDPFDGPLRDMPRQIAQVTRVNPCLHSRPSDFRALTAPAWVQVEGLGDSQVVLLREAYAWE